MTNGPDHMLPHLAASDIPSFPYPSFPYFAYCTCTLGVLRWRWFRYSTEK